MATVLLTGVGALGGWALEFLARAPEVERIVTVKRSPWPGTSRPALARLGAVLQGHDKAFEHHRVDLADRKAMAQLLAAVRPDAVLHSATVRSPRALMQVPLAPERREALRAATFGMWLPWHLLPATRLTEAVAAAGVDTLVVNASFPDVVNPALWRRFGHGPAAGAGNVEVLAAQVQGHAADAAGVPAEEVKVSLIGSHALLSYGPAAGVPHHFRLRIRGEDVTADYDLGAALRSWPEPVDWRAVEVFSPFAASAVKNVTALLGDSPMRTHVTAPNGLPGGYPAVVGKGRIDLDLPEGLTVEEAVALNEAAARWDGIERIEGDGTVTYTAAAGEAMTALGYRVEAVAFAELRELSDRLDEVYRRLVEEAGDAPVRP